MKEEEEEEEEEEEFDERLDERPDERTSSWKATYLTYIHAPIHLTPIEERRWSFRTPFRGKKKKTINNLSDLSVHCL
jgi:hypothetical protein